jgi:DNA-binding transcriptional MerR regulator
MTAAASESQAPRRERLLTIGAVCRRLSEEFPDISISKIRYLEDQGLLAPRRTQGGYRLFSSEDVERLETILRLQRDEFLPLRVIREELSSPVAKERKRRRPGLSGPEEEELTVEELCERSGAAPDLVKELAEFGLLEPRTEAGERLFTETDVDVATACARLSQFGIAPRHLRTFRSSADRQAALLEQLVSPALRSRNPERRASGQQELQTLAELSQELAQLLFWRGLRDLART